MALSEKGIAERPDGTPGAKFVSRFLENALEEPTSIIFIVSIIYRQSGLRKRFALARDPAARPPAPPLAYRTSA